MAALGVAAVAKLHANSSNAYSIHCMFTCQSQQADRIVCAGKPVAALGVAAAAKLVNDSIASEKARRCASVFQKSAGGIGFRDWGSVF